MAQPQYQPSYPSAPRPAPRPRRRGGLRLLLIAVAVLLVVAAVADRVGAALAARELHSRVAAELSAHDVTYDALDVSVGGLPFLTQVAQGRLDSIAIDLSQVHLSSDGRQATLPALHVLATGVLVDPAELASGNTTAKAEQITGTAVVAYDTLSGLIDLAKYHLTDIAFHEEAGALRASADVTAFGVDLPIEAAVEVTLANGQIELRLRDAAVVGRNVPDFGLSAIDMIVNAVLVAFLPPLPFGITLDDVQAKPDGLAVTATGTDVTLAS